MRIILIIFTLTFNLNVFAQSDLMVGNYQTILGGGIIKYNLSLNPDGTFFFHFYRKLPGAKNPEENQYGKGLWKVESNLIYLKVDKEKDLDEKCKLNFDNSKARFISKSPRDKSNRVIKTSLKFYESDIFWVTGMELFKEKHK